MGVYLYGVKKSNPVKAQIEDKTITIHRLQYITKPGFQELGRTASFVVRTLRSAWDGKLPEYVAILEKDAKDTDVANVFANPKSVLWYDCDTISDEHVGWLFKRNKKYTVLSVVEFDTLVQQITGDTSWKKLIERKTVVIDATAPGADFVINFYRSYSWSGHIVSPEAMSFVA